MEEKKLVAGDVSKDVCSSTFGNIQVRLEHSLQHNDETLVWHRIEGAVWGSLDELIIGRVDAEVVYYPWKKKN